MPHALVPFVAARAGGTAFGIAGFLVIGIVWSILPEARGGMTLGKRLLGIRVVDHDGAGPIGLGRAALRWIVKYGVCGVLPVGYLWYFRNPSRRAWQDLAAGTSVIDVAVSPG